MDTQTARVGADDRLQLPLGETWPEIRALVRRICADFPGALLARARRAAGLSGCVRRRADRGGAARRLDPRGIRRPRAAPERRGGDAGGDPRERLQRRRLSRADVHHGHAAAARKRGAEAGLPAGDRRRPSAPAGLRRDRADHRVGHDPAQDPRREARRPLRDQRPEGVDLARPAVGPDAPPGAHDAARAGDPPERGALGVPDRYPGLARTGARDQAARRDDQPQHDRGVLRFAPRSGGEPDRSRKDRGSATSSTA